ncbi:hypothetical protein GCM10010924_11810 [Rhizobium wenxiniae]|uniref:Uncharacterized protein n=1 Tax=Rhizobium wenxiniae TaxID=1737357 RepID=A0A7W9Y2X4_9HYPH|nr:hypothetical protein [Rhizobium wenxiniae]MBB6161029.1 hypothetical protein [Rhizobium wenxiniae]GGF85845.1 hypothetical protein GCM10010924_11810 [Rhizobium wenxiniae]
MTASNSMPRSVAPVEGDANSKAPSKSELIDRLATEMRVKSGGELPLSYCIAQVKRQLASFKPDASATHENPSMPVNPPAGSVFQSWAIRD